MLNYKIENKVKEKNEYSTISDYVKQQNVCFFLVALVSLLF